MRATAVSDFVKVIAMEAGGGFLFISSAEQACLGHQRSTRKHSGDRETFEGIDY